MNSGNPPLQSKTPIDIHVRKFDPASIDSAPEYYFDNDAFKTHVLNGLSLLFPEGERFFIKSVLAYRDQVQDQKLLSEIKAFSAQEAQHTLVHIAMNELAGRHGYPVVFLDSYLGKLSRFLLKLSTKNRFLKRTALAITVCMEHFTAILAYQVLSDGDNLLSGMDPSIRALFEWHALEETEHKAVAFDTYKATGGSQLMLRIMMLLATAFFIGAATFNFLTLARHDGSLKRGSTWRSARRFLFSREQGYLVKPWKDWLAFFKPGFHPWKQHQDADMHYLAEHIQPYLKNTA